MHRGNVCGCHARFRLRPSGALPVCFGVVFCGVMDFAAEHGLRVLDYVFMTEDAKCLRGFEARTTVSLLKAVCSETVDITARRRSAPSALQREPPPSPDAPLGAPRSYGEV